MSSGFLGGGIGPTAIKRRSGLAAPVPVLGANILTDGDMEAAGVTSWIAYDAPPTREKSNAQTHGGSQSLHIVTDSATEGSQNLIGGLTSDWVQCSGYCYVVAGKMAPAFINGMLNTQYSVMSASSWNLALFIGRATTGIRVALLSFGGASEWYADDFNVQSLNLSSLFSARPYASANCDLSASVTCTQKTQAGLVARLDSATSPANFIIAYLDGGGNVRVDKCVGGTYTNVINGAATYGSTKILRLVCSGNNVSAYYDGTQVGTTQTVSDAGIVSNTRHGLFSTYAANSFAGYVAA